VVAAVDAIFAVRRKSVKYVASSQNYNDRSRIVHGFANRRALFSTHLLRSQLSAGIVRVCGALIFSAVVTGRDVVE